MFCHVLFLNGRLWLFAGWLKRASCATMRNCISTTLYTFFKQIITFLSDIFTLNNDFPPSNNFGVAQIPTLLVKFLKIPLHCVYHSSDPSGRQTSASAMWHNLNKLVCELHQYRLYKFTLVFNRCAGFWIVKVGRLQWQLQRLFYQGLYCLYFTFNSLNDWFYTI